MLQKAVEKILKGFFFNNLKIQARGLPGKRFREEINLDIFVSRDGEESHLMYAKIFTGRKPHYKPWVELFDIPEKINSENQEIEYFNSNLEESLYRFFGTALKPGEHMFVEYYRDIETRNQLEMDLPPPVTRLGYILFKLGFLWFKDWYFPEGFWEGEQKLQGEKPLSETEKSRQLKKLYHSVRSFLENIRLREPSQPFLESALNRARYIMESER